MADVDNSDHHMYFKDTHELHLSAVRCLGWGTEKLIEQMRYEYDHQMGSAKKVNSGNNRP